MVHVDLCWDEYGRNVLVCHGCTDTAPAWPVRLFPLGSAKVAKSVLTDDLVDQLETFGSAELAAQDEQAIVRRLGMPGQV